MIEEEWSALKGAHESPREMVHTEAKVAKQRSDRRGLGHPSTPTCKRAWDSGGTGANWQLPSESRFRKHTNHKGEDEAVLPEEKQRYLPNAEVRALFYFYFSSDEEKILLPSDLGLFL